MLGRAVFSLRVDELGRVSPCRGDMLSCSLDTFVELAQGTVTGVLGPMGRITIGSLAKWMDSHGCVVVELGEYVWFDGAYFPPDSSLALERPLAAWLRQVD